MNRYCATFMAECPKIQHIVPDGRVSAWGHTRPLLAGMSLILSTVISAAPLAAQGATPPRASRSLPQAPALGPDRWRAQNQSRLPRARLADGLGGWSLVWHRIQRPLSLTTRVCAWDPAGLGFSSESPEPQDAVHETQDLEEALKGAHIGGSYVMVAHSAGAYVTLTFTDHHRRAVVGMVLVDPAIPDEAAVRERIAPKFAAFGDMGPRTDVKRLRQCAAEIRSGRVRQGAPGFDRCTAQPLPAAFSSLSARLARLNADPARLLTQASAIVNASPGAGAR